MPPLHFNLAFVEALARHRTPLLTLFFQGASIVGSADFYVALIMLIYVAWDKRLGVRLSYLVLATLACNNLLKNMIRNPRPFSADGTFRQWWAVAPRQAASLAAEYSTPSGHAMSAGSFYSYLYISVRKTWVRIASVLLILLIGFSRPYLGVHYGEDIVLGWALGLGMALLGARYAAVMKVAWERRAYPLQIALAVAASIGICVASVALRGWRIDGQLLGIITCAGFVTGNVIACPLELRMVRFDARSGNMVAKLMRFMVTMGLISLVLIVRRLSIALLGLEDSIAGFVIEYVGYAAAGVAGMFCGPWLFTRMDLAGKEAPGDVGWAGGELERENNQEA